MSFHRLFLNPNKKAGEEPDDDIRSDPSLYILFGYLLLYG